MKLIVGLGNPDVNFIGSRHNTGFALLDNFALTNKLDWQTKPKFKATVAEGILEGQKVALAKPTTYYNLSGEAVRAIRDFYKLTNSGILVVHDELALPYGKLRTRHGGTDAGNNGIKSVIANIGQDFARLRVGIADPHTSTLDTADFVLGHFSHQELDQWPEISRQANQQIINFIDPNKKFEPTSVKVNQK